ncbi:MAG: HepT-like ribonuclease domain-containing protein, partial [Patescibacteria group bacterium]
KTAHPEIPWNEAIGMRNKVIHEYFGVDEDVLWKTIKEDLPAFGKRIRQLSEKP